MNTEQLTQLTNIKIENILEKYIIYLKDSFNYEDNEEFDYEYFKNNTPNYEDIEAYDYALKTAWWRSQKNLTYRRYKEECYIYFKELVINNFENLCDDNCYSENISSIVERYRGQTDDEYFENYDDILNEIDDEGEQMDINIDINNRYKFWANIEGYFNDIILDEEYELNKVDFVKSIIYSLNNPVFLK